MADDEPYVDPNSGLAPQPGSYAHTPYLEDGEEGEDPNPDPGGAEAIFATNGQTEATPVDEDGDPIDDDELEDADEDELEDPNPDPGGVESVPVENGQTEATPADGADGVTEDGDVVPGSTSDSIELDGSNPRQEDGWVDGASPDAASDANPGADEQVAGPEAEAVEEPHKGASRAAWVEFARSKGAPEEELADDGGLKRDELAAKYGSDA